jgi:putative multicomponent Na+:H+ antiporter subunit B
MEDSYVYFITALLPLSALMLVLQSNPYHALVTRGILGAVATLVYAVYGATDVALTEALVGTLLLITLYAVAVRSSLVLRLGIVEGDGERPGGPGRMQSGSHADFRRLAENLRAVLNKRHMRLELVAYPDQETLQQALQDKAVHAACTRWEPPGPDGHAEPGPCHQTVIRIRRLYEILRQELASSATHLAYLDPAEGGRLGKGDDSEGDPR